MEDLYKTVELKEQKKPKLKLRTDLHLARKIWHMGGVSLIAFIYSQIPEKTSIALLSLAWFLFVPFDFARQRYPAVNEVALLVFKPIMRQHEVNKIAGTTYLLSGLLLVACLFPPQIVLITMLFLAFADPIASYVGIRYGKDKIFGGKSLQGSMAAFFVCAVITFLYLSFHWLLMERLIVVSIAGGIIGALAELVPIGKLDDNFTLPVLSAMALWFLFTVFGAFAPVI